MSGSANHPQIPKPTIADRAERSGAHLPPAAAVSLDGTRLAEWLNEQANEEEAAVCGDPYCPCTQHTALIDDLRALASRLPGLLSDAERWQALVALIKAESERKPEAGALILWCAPPNEFDLAIASIQSVAWRAPTRTLWIHEHETIEGAIDSASQSAASTPTENADG